MYEGVFMSENKKGLWKDEEERGRKMKMLFFHDVNLKGSPATCNIAVADS